METIRNTLIDINNKLGKYKLNLYNEKTLQEQLYDLILKNLGFVREYKLDSHSIIDFYHPEKKIGIEVKIKGNVPAVFRQCKRYAKKEEIEHIILITSIAMNLPDKIENKPSYILRISNRWL